MALSLYLGELALLSAVTVDLMSSLCLLAFRRLMEGKNMPFISHMHLANVKAMREERKGGDRKGEESGERCGKGREERVVGGNERGRRK